LLNNAVPGLTPEEHLGHAGRNRRFSPPKPLEGKGHRAESEEQEAGPYCLSCGAQNGAPDVFFYHTGSLTGLGAGHTQMQQMGGSFSIYLDGPSTGSYRTFGTFELFQTSSSNEHFQTSLVPLPVIIFS
jgi:hypothetical protein